MDAGAAAASPSMRSSRRAHQGARPRAGAESSRAPARWSAGPPRRGAVPRCTAGRPRRAPASRRAPPPRPAHRPGPPTDPEECEYSLSFLLRDAAVELLAGVVQARADGDLGRADDVGDLGDVELLDLVQHEDDALLGRQPLERPVDPTQLLLLGEPLVGGERGAGHVLERVGVRHRRRAPRTRAEATEGDVDADAIEPGRQLGVAAEARHAAERDEKDLLHQVVELAAVAED